MQRDEQRVTRRTFVATGTLSMGAVLVHPAWAALARLPSVPRVPGNKRVLHIVGYSHIDAAWLWPWRDGSNEACATMQSATDRLTETPDFHYSHSSAAHYRWVERSDPRLFDVVRRYVKNGQFEPIGGWIVEPDCNIPGTESVVRQALYGKRYFQRAFGFDVVVGANPDSFGHGAGLPQLLRKAGIKYYCFQRPEANEMSGVPLVFQWEAPDGSRLLTGRIAYSYDSEAEKLPQVATSLFQPGLDCAMFWLGVGDHGGGPTKEHIRQVIAFREDPTLPELRFSTLQQFFTAVEQSPSYGALPVVRTELQHHSRGCYSAYGEGKALNRRAERWLAHAEAASAVAFLANAHPYPAAEYAEAWWKTLFCQFHDMLAGTSRYRDYEDVRDTVGAACDTAQANRIEALQAMARLVDTSHVPERCVFAFNPLPWARTALLEYHIDTDLASRAAITQLRAADGSTTPLQWRDSDGMMPWPHRVSARVELPPCGYRVFELVNGTPATFPMINSFVRVADREWGITMLKTHDGKELLQEPIGLVVIDDRNDTWAHDVVSFRDVIGRPTWTTTVVVESGPLVRTTRQIATWKSSTITMDTIERAGLDLVELAFVIDWHEHEEMLKLEIPTTLAATKVFAKVAGTTIERAVDGAEEPAQDYIAIEGTLDGEVYSLGLINAQTYSYDCLGPLLRTVLIRSAPFARHRPSTVPANDDSAWQDQGRQVRTFWIVRGKGTHTTLHLDRLAEECQTPADYIADSRHPGTEPWEASFVSVSPDNVLATAMKRAEDSDALIIRLQETTGTGTKATIESRRFGWSHAVTLSPWSVVTVRVDDAGAAKASFVLVDLVERA
jgi:alpha-mannosidase